MKPIDLALVASLAFAAACVPAGTTVALLGNGNKNGGAPLTALTVTPIPPPFDNRPALTFQLHANRSDARFTATFNQRDLGVVESPLTVSPQLGDNLLQIEADAGGSLPLAQNIQWKFDPTPPSTPGGFSALALSTHSLRLFWNQAGDDHGVSGYRLHYDTLQRELGEVYTGTGASVGPSPVPLSGASNVSITLDNLDAGQDYFFRVEAIDNAGNSSAMTNEVKVATHSGSTFNLTATQTVGTGSPAASVLTGDFNNDQVLDFASAAVTGSNQGQIIVRTGDPNIAGVYAPIQATDLAGTPVAFAADFLDADAFPDIAIVLRTVEGALTTDELFVATGVGDGTFKLGPALASTSEAGTAAGSFDAITIASVNGDQVPDLVAGGSSGATILYATPTSGRRNGTFNPLAQQVPATGVTAVLVRDLDLDGFADLAMTTSQGTATVLYSALVDDGTSIDLVKAAPVTLAPGAPSHALAVTDLDGDDVEDLAVVTGQAVLMFRAGSSNGRSNRSFAAAAPVLAGTQLGSINIDDYNGDVIPDIAVLETGSAQLITLTGQGANGRGNGQFAKHRTLAVGAAPIGLVRGDFSGDGIADLATISSIDGEILPLIADGSRKRGDGGFGAAQIAPTTPGSIGNVVCADVNSDDLDDLLTSVDPNRLAQQSVTVLTGLGTNGRGSGTFAKTSEINCPPASLCPADLAVGDFNLDGIADLVNLDRTIGGGSLALHFGNGGKGVGNGTFQLPAYTPLLRASPLVLAAGDLNADRLADAAVLSANGSIHVLLNTAGTLTLGSIISGTGSGLGIAIADFDLDGIPDLATMLEAGTPLTSRFDVHPGTPRPLPNTVHRANGTFGPPVSVTVASTQSLPGIRLVERSLRVGDLTGDGFPDLAALAFDGRTSYLLIAVSTVTGNGWSLSPSSPLPITQTAPGSLQLADLDEDRRLDYVVSLAARGDVYVLRGDGYGSVLERNVLTGLGTPGSALAVGDFNEDGALDAVVIGSDAAGMMAVLFGTGTPTRSG